MQNCFIVSALPWKPSIIIIIIIIILLLFNPLLLSFTKKLVATLIQEIYPQSVGKKPIISSWPVADTRSKAEVCVGGQVTTRKSTPVFDLRSTWIWSSSNSYASRQMFFIVWPFNASQHKSIASQLCLREIYLRGDLRICLATHRKSVRKFWFCKLASLRDYRLSDTLSAAPPTQPQNSTEMA